MLNDYLTALESVDGLAHLYDKASIDISFWSALEFNNEKKLKTSIDYLSEKLISYEFAINKKEKTAIDIKNTKFGNSREYLTQKTP